MNITRLLYFFQKLLVERVKPLFYTRMLLGEFDPPTDNPYLQLNLSVIQSRQHRELATLAAQQSLVLLKNDGLLPLKQRYQNVAVSIYFVTKKNICCVYCKP